MEQDQDQKLTFEKITAQNADEAADALMPIMIKAFDEDTKMFLGEETGGPRGYDDGSLIRKLAIAMDHSSYTILLGDRLIGAAVVKLMKEGTGWLELLFIDPAVGSRGLGVQVWRFIVQTFPQVTRWRVETPGYSKRNHYFYMEKCGFTLVEKRNSHIPADESYILEKRLTT